MSRTLLSSKRADVKKVFPGIEFCKCEQSNIQTVMIVEMPVILLCSVGHNIEIVKCLVLSDSLK